MGNKSSDTILGQKAISKVVSDEAEAIDEIEHEEYVTDILREKQTIQANFDYCQERAALLRDVIDIWQRSGLPQTPFSLVYFALTKMVCDDILSADTPVIPF